MDYFKLGWFEQFIRDGLASQENSITKFTRYLKQDLINLLTTPAQKIAEKNLMILNSSLANYGVPVFSENKLASNQDILAYCDLLKNTIELFEPRLISVDITPENNSVNASNNLCLLITAYLRPVIANIKLVARFIPIVSQFNEFKLYYER